MLENSSGLKFFLWIQFAQKWDRSHELENLSGMETDCAMLTAVDWPFAAATAEASARHYRISGLYDYAVNYGSTEEAMIEILRRFKAVSIVEDSISIEEALSFMLLQEWFLSADYICSCSQIPGFGQVGCSLIPDCMGGRGDIQEMFVVVACVFRED